MFSAPVHNVGEENLGARIDIGYINRGKKIKIAEAKRSLAPWVSYPLVVKPQTCTCCPTHKVKRGTHSDGENFGAEMSFSTWPAKPDTQLANGR
jgi:hypothetical protein